MDGVAFDSSIHRRDVRRIDFWYSAFVAWFDSSIFSRGTELVCAVFYSRDLALEGRKTKKGATRRCRQQPPRQAVDRLMKLKHHRCSLSPTPAAVPELR